MWLYCGRYCRKYYLFVLQDCIKQHDVVVLTAQIVVNCLKDPGQRSRLMMSEIDLLILDECHHANLDHPYNNIMRSAQGSYCIILSLVLSLYC